MAYVYFTKITTDYNYYLPYVASVRLFMCTVC